MKPNILVSTKKILLLAVAIPSLGGMRSLELSLPVLFQSLESKTVEEKPVYNQVRFFDIGERDVWMMNQSHHGLEATNETWDRVAIVINKTVSPKTAEFYQLPPGKLEWSDDLRAQRIELKAACLRCHSNGPRAIRPDYSAGPGLNWRERSTVFLLNLKIKHYGRIKVDQKQEQENSAHSGSLRVELPGARERLNVGTCNRCHSEDGFLARGPLTRENAGTIEFLVKNGLMPPLGIPLEDADRQKIDEFTRAL